MRGIKGYISIKKLIIVSLKRFVRRGSPFGRSHRFFETLCRERSLLLASQSNRVQLAIPELCSPTRSLSLVEEIVSLKRFAKKGVCSLRRKEIIQN